MTQDGMHGDGRGFEQDGLFIAHVGWDAKELPLGQQHFFAPAAPYGLRTGEVSLLTQAVIAGGT